jgi:hypothetical protein
VLSRPLPASPVLMMANDLVHESHHMSVQRDAIALANAIVACRLVDGPPKSPTAREADLIRSIGLDIIRAIENESLSAEAEHGLLEGLARFSEVCTFLTYIAVEIIHTGQRSGFNISNLDSFLSSPYVMPDVAEAPLTE